MKSASKIKLQIARMQPTILDLRPPLRLAITKTQTKIQAAIPYTAIIEYEFVANVVKSRKAATARNKSPIGAARFTTYCIDLPRVRVSNRIRLTNQISEFEQLRATDAKICGTAILKAWLSPACCENSNPAISHVKRVRACFANASLMLSNCICDQVRQFWFAKRYGNRWFPTNASSARFNLASSSLVVRME